MTEAEADRRLVRNERSKLTATYLNGLAVAVAAIGGNPTLLVDAAGSYGTGGSSGWFKYHIGG